MSEKCFCHLGEYEVKDAKARQEIEELKANSGGSLYLHSLSIWFSYKRTGTLIEQDHSIICDLITNFPDEITTDNILDLLTNYYSETYGERCLHHSVEMNGNDNSAYKIIFNQLIFKNRNYPGDTSPYLALASTAIVPSAGTYLKTTLFLKREGITTELNGQADLQNAELYVSGDTVKKL